MVFEPVVLQNQNRSQLIVGQIKDLISSGKLKPGDKLPSERELAVTFNVSRVSVREAFKGLAAMGLLEVKRGQGVFIIQSTIKTILNQLGGTLVFKKDDILDLFQVRKTLEVQAVKWAAERAETCEIDHLIELVKEAKEYISGSSIINYEIAWRHDTLFHATIYNSAKNVILERIMDSHLDILAESRVRTLSIPGRAVQSIYDHERIAISLARRDARQAGLMMYKHLENVEHSIRFDIGKDGCP